MPPMSMSGGPVVGGVAVGAGADAGMGTTGAGACFWAGAGASAGSAVPAQVGDTQAKGWAPIMGASLVSMASTSRILSEEQLGCCDSSRAAMPDTCGADMLVPRHEVTKTGRYW